MSSFKADSRFTRRHDDACDDSHAPNDEFVVEESDVPRHMHGLRRAWYATYAEELTALYEAFTDSGDALFGPAFNQLGSLGHFAEFVFKVTHPGAL